MNQNRFRMRKVLVATAGLFTLGVAVLGCSTSQSSTGQDGSSTGTGGTGGGAGGSGGMGGTGGAGGVGGGAGSSGSGGSSSDLSAPSDAASVGGDASVADAGGLDSGPGGMTPTFVPKPTGTCPTFAQGAVTFSPKGIPPRQVQIWMTSAAKTMHGPLIFYWHGYGSSPTAEPPSALSNPILTDIQAKGGIVAAPFHDSAAGMFPWFLIQGSREDDLVLADEVVACAIQQLSIDVRHIHSLGMSAGGLQTTQMSYRRSGYLASVVTYSGGQFDMVNQDAGQMVDIPNQDPSNKFAAMIFHGGTTDTFTNTTDNKTVHFDQTSRYYQMKLRGLGHFAFICDHTSQNPGHAIPSDTPSKNAVWKYFQDHPYGTDPSPYAASLPMGFPSYCTLQ